MVRATVRFAAATAAFFALAIVPSTSAEAARPSWIGEFISAAPAKMDCGTDTPSDNGPVVTYSYCEGSFHLIDGRNFRVNCTWDFPYRELWGDPPDTCGYSRAGQNCQIRSASEVSNCASRLSDIKSKLAISIGYSRRSSIPSLGSRKGFSAWIFNPTKGRVTITGKIPSRFVGGRGGTTTAINRTYSTTRNELTPIKIKLLKRYRKYARNLGKWDPVIKVQQGKRATLFNLDF